MYPLFGIAEPSKSDYTLLSDSKSQTLVADSEDHCSVSATPVSPGEEFTNGSASKRLANAFNLGLAVPKVEKDSDPALEDDGEVRVVRLFRFILVSYTTTIAIVFAVSW
ncbi:unnamed protein product [Strongylus vulgaris]|uniref:Uncharacterized protein n=1 Tax=Strongylus vulgaris TaxID=40348 RepID=A0A3P7JKW5_STRVU|nr:unnamed protein product [Strongylus vulgaris]